MLNLYEAVRSNPSYSKLEIGDFLFAEYTCGAKEKRIPHSPPLRAFGCPIRRPRWEAG